MPDPVATTATAVPLNAKQRLIAFAAALPDDTLAIDVIVADAGGKITNTGLGMGLHTAAAMLIGATAGIAVPLANEADAIGQAAKLLTATSLSQALAALDPTLATAATQPAA